MEDHATDILLGTPLGLWRDAFRRFETILRLSPWGWFSGADAFAIHPDGYDEPFFVHPVDGEFGGGKGLALVYGWNGDALFRQLRRGIPHALTRSYEIPFVLCAVRPPAAITPLERNILETVGEPVEGREAVPVLVSFRPGWLPWHLSRVEVESTARVLEQALGVLLRTEHNRELAFPAKPAGQTWVRRRDAKVGRWEEGWTALRPFRDPGEGRDMELPEKLVAEAAALPDDVPSLEVACDIVPKIALLTPDAVKIRGEDGRIPLGYFFAISPYGSESAGVPSESGVFYPAGDIGSLRKFFPNVLVKYFVAKRRRAREIVVSSPRMMDILRPLQLRIPFRLTFHERLPSFDRVHALVAKAVAEHVK